MKTLVSFARFTWHRGIRISSLLLALFAVPLIDGAAQARPPMFEGFQAGAGERQRPDRRSDLRDSLAPRGDREAFGEGRRKLSSEERSALRRDLRDAMRGAYPEEPRPRKKN